MDRTLPARRARYGLIVAAAFVAILGACQPRVRSQAPAPAPRPDSSLSSSSGVHLSTAALEEQAVQYLPLAGPIRRDDAELSGLAWYEDWLVLLPQYPSREGADGDAYVYAIERSAIEQALADSVPTPITPRRVPVVMGSLYDRVRPYDGCEALAFIGDQVYVLVESSAGEAEPGADREMRSYILSGQVAPGLSHITVDTLSIMSVPMPASIPNMAYEALVARHDTLVALYEANGANIVVAPHAQRFTRTLQDAGAIPSPTLEYRITDATDVDSSGRFWVINYFYPGEREQLNPAPDSLVIQYGTGLTHSRSDVVERLVEMQIVRDRVRRTGTAPVPLVLRPDAARNWEGLARLGTKGFLIVTDRFPETLLAFVPAVPEPRVPVAEPGS